MNYQYQLMGFYLIQIVNQYYQQYLKKWFDERVLYKNKMKLAYKSGNKELGATFHMKQYTMKILLEFTCMELQPWEVIQIWECYILSLKL